MSEATKQDQLPVAEIGFDGAIQHLWCYWSHASTELGMAGEVHATCWGRRLGTSRPANDKRNLYSDSCHLTGLSHIIIKEIYI